MGGFRSWVISILFVAMPGCKDSTAPGTAPAPTPGSAGPAVGSGGVPSPSPTLPADLRVELGSCAPAAAAPTWISNWNPKAVPGSAFATIKGPAPLSSGFGSGSGPAGAGIGTGYPGPGMRGRRMVVPVTKLGQATVVGDLDKNIIRRYLRRNLQKMQYCYEKQLVTKPQLAGTVTASFTIKTDGRVAGMKATGIDADVSKCIGDVIAAIEFPKPKGTGDVKVTYPMTFEPPPGSAGGPGAGTAMALDEANKANKDPDRPTGQNKMNAPTTTATLDRATPAAPSLLQGHEDGLRECLRKQTTPYGVALVHLGTAPDAVEVFGIEDKAAAACIATLAKTLKEPRKEAMRCSLAFGALPLATARGVDVTDMKVKYDGKDLGAQDPMATGKIDALHDAAKAHADKEIDDVVAMTGPVVVRVADSAPMPLVHRVLATLKLAGESPVIAHDKNGTLSLVHAGDALPAVPLPPGKGGAWDGPREAIPDDSAFLVVLVRDKKIWVGLTRVNEMQAVEAEPLDRLSELLAAHKQSARFSSRRDAELGAEGAVTYGQLRKVHEAMVRAGFTDVAVLGPDELSVRFQE